MDTEVLEIDTTRRRTVDLTGAVRAFCAQHGSGHSDGLCNVFVPHATAGVAIIETGAGSDDDLVDTLERLLPRDGRYPPRARVTGATASTWGYLPLAGDFYRRW